MRKKRVEPGSLWVVIPCFNEAKGLRATLDALHAQGDRRFSLVVVDNASTDVTSDVVRAFAEEHPSLDLHLVHEPQKGTGAAADTGFRYAIEHGATHIARTDGDCIPRPDWIENIKHAFGDGIEFLAGHIGHRTDDYELPLVDHVVLTALTELMAAVSPYLSHNRGPEFRGPYVMAGGGNLATTAELYLASGGFPRIAIEDDNDDRALQNRIRKLTDRIAKRRDVVVYQSTRRVQHYGFRNTLLWYWNRKYRPVTVDIR